jgi:hypothetical protein
MILCANDKDNETRVSKGSSGIFFFIHNEVFYVKKKLTSKFSDNLMT